MGHLIIAMDAKFLSHRYGGLGTYTIKILEGLAALDLDEIVALVPAEWPIDVDPRGIPANVTLLRVSSAGPNPGNFFEYRVYWEQEVLPRKLGEIGPDVFFGPVFMVPLRWNGACVATVHDLAFERSAEHNHGPSTRYYRQWARRCAEKATILTTVSRSTADDVRRLWQLDKRIVPIPLAPCLDFVPTDRYAARKVIQETLGIEEEYILHVGGWHPRKNVYGVLEAYKRIDRGLQARTRLVLVGPTSPDSKGILEKTGLASRVVVTGYCSPDLLPHLYAAASVLVYPSLFEGFGLPPLEAMLCGVPVVTSNAGAIPEVVGDAALIVDPTDIGGLAAAIEMVLTDKGLRRCLVERGYNRVSRFSWQETARQTREVLWRAVKEPW